VKLASDLTTNLQSSAVTEKTTTKLNKILAPTVMMALNLLYFLIPLVSAASWRENTLISLSQTIATIETQVNRILQKAT
uniref:Uncharacterized protein n=1 Tax=Bos indicus x Bos taurus TaxID=30522 RepID=A0A4W2F0R6_BOBOX